MRTPQFLLLTGPNGAGKSTCAPVILPPEVSFLNADELAKGLPLGPQGARDVRAGCWLLELLEECAARRADFAVETTLANRALLPRIRHLQEHGYRFHLIYIWLCDAELAVARVAQRVRAGGHAIPEATIRRRYRAGQDNLFHRYLPLADSWHVFDNSRLADIRLVAAGKSGGEPTVYAPDIWERMQGKEQHG